MCRNCGVVNIKKTKKYDVYIGRGLCPVTGKPSKWYNPYSHLEISSAEFKVE